MVHLLAFVLPLGLDTFAVAAALGALPLTSRDRRRVSAVLVGFEAGMPLVGVALGAPVARALAGHADVVSGVALAGVGLWLILGEHDDDESDRLTRLRDAGGLAVLGLGLAISLDELAVGFGLGLTRLPVAGVVVATAVQAVLATQLGLRLGARVGARAREHVERLAGGGLVVLGVLVAAGAL
jgi:manganese efflux pump family protein